MEILQYTFFQYSLLGSFFTAVACGIVGSYIVARRLLFISGGITHASFGGVGLGFYLGVNPLLTAVFFSVLSAFGVEWMSRSHQVREDSAIACIWSLGMALGILFVYLTPGYSPNLSAYLFGNILSISASDLLAMGLLAVVLTVLFSLFLKTVLYISFDSDFARTQRLPVAFVEYAMSFFIALTIVFSIRMVGIMLLMSMLTMPQIIVNIFTSNFRRMILCSIGVGFLACLAGLAGSYFLDVPSGAFIVIVLVVLFLLARLLTVFKGRK
ncbi:MAG: metal ABC transporter permease [Tannerellaceae bacterium]|nr:metal ABC transporter permease [Tannerellaceae bacterium]